MATTPLTLDRFDRRILEVLQQEGRISNQELAERIGLSPSPCLRRVRALEEHGLITQYRAVVDARPLGYQLMALLHISMDQHTPERFDNFERHIRNIPNVVECLTPAPPRDQPYRRGHRGPHELRTAPRVRASPRADLRLAG